MSASKKSIKKKFSDKWRWEIGSQADHTARKPLGYSSEWRNVILDRLKTERKDEEC